MDARPDVFVSYAHQSSEVTARLLRNALAARGIQTFVAVDDIKGGSDYTEKLAGAIASSRLVVLLLTDAANRSNFVHNEIVMALTKHGRPILPVLLEKITPAPRLELLLAATQWLDLSSESQASQAASISEAVAARLGEAPDSESDITPRINNLSTGTSDRPMRVAMIYKRGAQPDETLLAFLEEGLKAAGHSVFIDRHMTIGVEWAKQIADEIAGADAVVPLISPASVGSEMLAYEIQVAHEAAQAGDGRPRILPIRIDLEGPLTGELGAILNPLHYAFWRSPEDNARLAAELCDGLRTPQRSATTPIAALESVGGAVPLDSKFYIERPVDSEFRAGLTRGDSVLLIKGPRQIGKTSLLARGSDEARKVGVKVVLTDLQKLASEQLDNIDTFFLALGHLIAHQLELDKDPETDWRPKRSSNLNFERFLGRQILGSFEGALLWALDETDRLFDKPYCSEVFSLFRTWHNERAIDPGGPWKRLTLAIAYATEAHLFIRDPNQSPFNIGTALLLEDFSLEQVAELNRRYGSPISAGEELRSFHRLLGGHPFLVRRALDVLVRKNLGLAALADQADLEEGPFGDHLRRMLVLLVRDEQLCDVVRAFLKKPGPLKPQDFYRLHRAGLLTGPTRDRAGFRCQVYESYLRRQLL